MDSTIFIFILTVAALIAALAIMLRNPPGNERPERNIDLESSIARREEAIDRRANELDEKYRQNLALEENIRSMNDSVVRTIGEMLRSREQLDSDMREHMIESQREIARSAREYGKMDLHEEASGIRADLSVLKSGIEDTRSAVDRQYALNESALNDLRSRLDSISSAAEGIPGGDAARAAFTADLLNAEAGEGTGAPQPLIDILTDLLPEGDCLADAHIADGLSPVPYAIRLRSKKGEISYLPVFEYKGPGSVAEAKEVTAASAREKHITPVCVMYFESAALLESSLSREKKRELQDEGIIPLESEGMSGMLALIRLGMSPVSSVMDISGSKVATRALKESIKEYARSVRKASKRLKQAQEALNDSERFAGQLLERIRWPDIVPDEKEGFVRAPSEEYYGRDDWD